MVFHSTNIKVNVILNSTIMKFNSDFKEIMFYQKVTLISLSILLFLKLLDLFL